MIFIALLRGERPIGYWDSAGTGNFARIFDTVIEARYAELAHAYASLIQYDSVQQIMQLLSVGNRNISGQFSLPSGQRLNDRNRIIQSLQRNSGLYIPIITFYDISIPYHQKTAQRN